MNNSLDSFSFIALIQNKDNVCLIIVKKFKMVQAKIRKRKHDRQTKGKQTQTLKE